MNTLASEVREETGHLASQAKGQVLTLITEQKHRAAERLGTLAGTLRGAGDKCGSDELASYVGRYAHGAAEQVDSLSRWVREADIDTLARDTGQFARRRPEVFVGGALLVGFLAARFLKASGGR